jgi:Fe-S-cluster-containing hydrogenase component 2
MSYLENGVLELAEIRQPSPERQAKGRVAVIECIQHIPCNPCVDICPQKAIQIPGEITNLPIVDFDKCNGCGLCVANCPGLAIFLVNEAFTEDRAEVGIPYELVPLPKKGDTVTALNRAGKPIAKATVLRVVNPARYDRTAIIYLAVPKGKAMDVRFFQI